MGVHRSAHDPPERGDTGIERSFRVWHLRYRNVHGRKRIAIETSIVRVADNADDLAWRLGKDRARTGPDLNPILERIAFGPKPFGHRLVDDYHAGCGAIVVLRKAAAAQKRNL